MKSALRKSTGPGRMVPRMAAIGALMLVAACAGDSQTATDDTQDSTVAETPGTEQDTETQGSGEETEVEDLGTLTVAYVSENSLVYMGVQEGNNLGAWVETGVTVEVVSTDDAAATQLLAGGNVDIVAQTAVRLTESVKQGTEASIVGGIRKGNSQFLFVTDDSGAESIEDLRGGTFGISGFGSPGHFSTASAVDGLGWTEDDYEIVALGGLAEIRAAVQQGSIDAFFWSAPVSYTLEAEGHGTILGHIGDYAADQGLISFSASNSVVEERPEAVAAFLDGFYGLIEEFQADPSIPKSIMVDEWGQAELAADAALETELDNMYTSPEISDKVLSDVVDMSEFFTPDTELSLEDVESMYRPVSLN